MTTTVDSTKNLVGANLAAAVFTGMTAIPQVQLKIAGLTNPTVVSSTAQNVCVVDTLSALAGLLTGVTNTGANPGPTSSTLAGVAGLVDNTCIGSTILTQLTNGVTTQLLVAPVLSMSLDSSNVSFNLTPTASGVVASGATNAITIATNAGTYTVQALVAGTSPVLTWAGSGTAASIPLSFNSATGSAPAACPANGVGTGTLGSGGSYQNVVSSVTGLTNGTVTNIGYCWKVDLTKPVGSYATTITYLAVPAF